MTYPGSRAIATVALYSAIACSGPPASRAIDELNAAERAELEVLPEGSPPERVLASMAKKWAAGLIAAGPVVSGRLEEGKRGDHLTVLREGFCYRVLAAGEDAVQDMDLFLYDPSGVQMQQDATEDRLPVLGSDAELCPQASGAFRVQVFMYKGAGAYALRVYKTP
jgi:hypothetical protein